MPAITEGLARRAGRTATATAFDFTAGQQSGWERAVGSEKLGASRRSGAGNAAARSPSLLSVLSLGVIGLRSLRTIGAFVTAAVAVIPAAATAASSAATAAEERRNSGSKLVLGNRFVTILVERL